MYAGIAYRIVVFQMTYVLSFQISGRLVADIVELIGRVVSDAILAAISDEMAIVSHVKHCTICAINMAGLHIYETQNM